MDHQAQVPTPERFGIAIAAILTGGDDYGTYPAAAPQKMLASSWGVHNTADAMQAIEALLGTSATGDALAFDRVRAVHVARAAAGATFIDQATSWRLVKKASQDVQTGFDSWRDLGDAYLRAKNDWLEERGLDTADGTEATVTKLAAGMWASIPWELSLDRVIPAAGMEMPPSMGQIVGNRAKDIAAERAASAANSAVWNLIRQYVPHSLLPLIPGYSNRSAMDIYKERASKYMWGIISGAIFTVVFFGLAGFILLSTLCFVGFSVVQTM